MKKPSVTGEVVIDVYRKFVIKDNEDEFQVSGPEQGLWIQGQGTFSGLRISRVALEKIVEMIQTTKLEANK